MVTSHRDIHVTVAVLVSSDLEQSAHLLITC
jgi:hypothetical protein